MSTLVVPIPVLKTGRVLRSLSWVAAEQLLGQGGLPGYNRTGNVIESHQRCEAQCHVEQESVNRVSDERDKRRVVHTDDETEPKLLVAI
jgi:hypothetical protein